MQALWRARPPPVLLANKLGRPLSSTELEAWVSLLVDE
jgi:hypothetical protein